VKPNTNSVELHPQLSNTGHPVDGAALRCSPVHGSSINQKQIQCILSFLYSNSCEFRMFDFLSYAPVQITKLFDDDGRA
jgi:hypothetical protein